MHRFLLALGETETELDTHTHTHTHSSTTSKDMLVGRAIYKGKQSQTLAKRIGMVHGRQIES